MKAFAPLVLLGLAACGRVEFDARGDASDGDASGDVRPDAPTMFGPWSQPQLLPGASDSSLEEEDGTLSSQKTEIFFNRGDDIWRMERPTAADPWGAPSPVAGLNTASIEETPRLSADDLTIYFASDRNGASEIFRSTRPTPGQPWSTPVPIPEVSNNGAWNSMHWLSPCTDGHYVTARYEVSTDYDLYEGVLGAGAPSPLTALNTPTFDSSPYVTPDCTTMYWATDRTNVMDIYITTRASPADAWGPIALMTEIAWAGSSEQDPALSQDRTLFIFTSDKGGTKDLYFMTRSPL